MKFNSIFSNIFLVLLLVYFFIVILLFFYQRKLLYHPGENNLPLGVQLIGDKYDDQRFLGIARWLEEKSKEHNE